MITTPLKDESEFALSLQHLKANEGKGIKLGKVMETNETDKVVDIFACIFSGLTCGT